MHQVEANGIASALQPVARGQYTLELVEVAGDAHHLQRAGFRALWNQLLQRCLQAHLAQKVGAVEHHRQGQPFGNGKAADEVVGGVGTGSLEPFVAQKPETQLHDVDPRRTHCIEITLDDRGGEVPGGVVATITEGTVEHLAGDRRQWLDHPSAPERATHVAART
ncbi:hypothetical protein RXS04_04300 [Pseudomonas aeruginosa]|nr:hypothetical protein [Pseudomonas aeruginosa]MEB5358932.1 hypothetical protein [Pseudomonas aeruginosa]MEB5439591.1 hypothetical protein [Pseudomonas aeruginosa]